MLFKCSLTIKNVIEVDKHMVLLRVGAPVPKQGAPGCRHISLPVVSGCPLTGGLATAITGLCAVYLTSCLATATASVVAVSLTTATAIPGAHAVFACLRQQRSAGKHDRPQNGKNALGSALEELSARPQLIVALGLF